jgi:hypothetical protein
MTIVECPHVTGFPPAQDLATGKWTVVNDIVLYKGQSNTVTCMIEADNVPGMAEQKLIKIESNYGYMSEKQATVTVTGR